MRHFFIYALCALLFVPSTTLADRLVRVELEPITHSEAQLVVVGADGTETAFTPADLETLPTYSLSTRTPWRDEPATFEGVRLRDLLSAAGLDAISDIRVIAENDFSTQLKAPLINSIDILVATRVNGRAHTHRERGPIQFVMHFDYYKRSPLTDEANYVWMAARIEPDN